MLETGRSPMNNARRMLFAGLGTAIVFAVLVPPFSEAANERASNLPACVDLARQRGYNVGRIDPGARQFMRKAYVNKECRTTDGRVYHGEPLPKIY